MEKLTTYYHLDSDDKFRTFHTVYSNGTHKYGLKKRIKIFKFIIWITILSVTSIKEPTINIGCIPHPFRRLSKFLNNIQCYN